MLIIVYVLAALMGFTLGLLGAGGAVLSIPIFVYLVGMSSLDAISCSLFVVCLTSISAGVRYMLKRQIDYKAVLLFGLPSIIAVWFFRAQVLPRIPDPLLKLDHFEISKAGFLLFMFAILVFYASLNMIFPKKIDTNEDPDTNSMLRFLLNGFFVGSITGLLGAGGGFLIVPALVLLLGLDFKKAAGSSLLIIGINTATGLLSKTDQLISLDWNFLLGFTGIAILASFLGAYVSGIFASDKLKPAFGYFLMTVAVYMIVRELFF